MKTLTLLYFLVAGCVAIVSAIKIPGREPKFCQPCTYPTCSTTSYATEVILKEESSLFEGDRTFQSEKKKDGSVDLVAQFSIPPLRPEEFPPGFLINYLQKEVVFEVEVSSEVGMEGTSTVIKSQSMTLLLGPGSTCSTPLPEGYTIDNVSNVAVYMDKKM